MTTTLEIGSRRELFLDTLLIDRLNDCRLKLHEPISAGTAIGLDRPWEGPASFGGSVIYHDGRYLLYYRALWPSDEQGAFCVAVSDDAMVWTKPALGLVAHSGSNETNIVSSVCGTAAFEYHAAPWVDTRPGVPADEIIKATTSEPLSGEKHTANCDPGGAKRIGFWGSPDGLRFHRLDPQPELISNLFNCFDGGTTMFWSAIEEQYVFYYRFMDEADGVFRRTMARTTSPDLMRWTEPVPMTYGDTPREQFYVDNTQPYFRAPHIYVAPAARFMQGRSAVTEAEAAAIGLCATRGGDFRSDCSDGVLLTSRAGSRQYDRTFMETFVRPGIGASNWVSRANYPLTGILPCGADHMMIFVARHYMQPSWHIERMLLRTDGFASVNAPWAGGEMVTKPFVFAGSELEINYRTGAAGSVRIEIQDEGGKPLPGYALADCAEIIGDEIERVVKWQQGPDLSKLAGRPIRLRFAMKDADVFALKFGG